MSEKYTEGWNDGYRHAIEDLSEKLQDIANKHWASEEETEAISIERAIEKIQDEV